MDAGIDANNNGALDADEISSTQYVCNGETGAGALQNLVTVVAEPPGANCITGGKKISVGADANGNGVLDADETSSSDYVCNGLSGLDGIDGADGTDGINGIDGTDGADGANGIDGTDGADGYEGPAGPGVSWVQVTGATQAVPNTGYLANSTAAVTITLPTSPAIGDIVKVTGVGLGGWQIAQNADQVIVTKNLRGSFGAEWKKLAFSNVSKMASSANGRTMAASANGVIYTSSDYGVTWTARSSSWWNGIAISADGTRMAAATGSYLHISTDSGVNWTQHALTKNWKSIAMSADGTKLIAGEAGSVDVYTSIDAGLNWTARRPNPGATLYDWNYVTISSDGTKMMAMATGTKKALYRSTNGGETWVAISSVNGANSIAASADGTKWAISATNNYLFTFRNSGASMLWHESIRNWGTVVSSADGNRLAAAVLGASGMIYVSTDAGFTWTPREYASWQSLMISADGSRIAAVAPGFQYTSGNTTPGVTGSVSGVTNDAIELQYIGDNRFSILSHAGELTVK